MKTYLQTLNNGLTPEKVQFSSGDGFVVAHLYLPENFDATNTYPAAVTSGAFTTVKEQTAGVYAGELARRGIIGLAIDYRHYGESSGKIRQYEDQKLKAEDLVAAASYLKTNFNTIGVALLAICSSASAALYALANIPNQIDAFATISGSFAESSDIPNREELIALSQAAKESYEKTGQADTMTVYQMYGQPGALFPIDIPFYMETERGNIPEWRNELAVLSLNSWSATNSAEYASKVKTPALIVHSQGSSQPEKAQEIYNLLKGPKNIVWLEGEHTDFYDVPKQVTSAADQVSTFFMEVYGE